MIFNVTYIDGGFNGKTILLLNRKKQEKLRALELTVAGNMVLEMLLEVSS